MATVDLEAEFVEGVLHVFGVDGAGLGEGGGGERVVGDQLDRVNRRAGWMPIGALTH